MTLRIGNGAGFLGDQLDAPRRLVESAELDYLTLEYLAELTMSILAYQKQKHPALGYARDLVDVLSSLLPSLKAQGQLSVITNGGGINPIGCTLAAAKLCSEAGIGDIPLAAIDGDDLLSRIDELQQAGCNFAHMDSGQPFKELMRPAVAANAYLGAAGIVDALTQNARIVITGRVADASLTVGPAIHHYQWNWNDWQQLAGASVAGHLIECGAQVTGGYSQRWRDLRLEDVGYPIAEIDADGSSIITKPTGSGGCVDRQSVVEQLVYEIDDPRAYKTPDVIVNFASVHVDEQGSSRVAVSGASGQPPSDYYKISLAYQDGFTASAQLIVAGRDCLQRAQYCAEIIRHRLARVGLEPKRLNVERLGAGESLPRSDGTVRLTTEPIEVVLRLTACDSRREVVERFTREIAPLITSGPAGLAGYAAARSVVRPVFAYWPALIPKNLVQPRVQVRTAREWVDVAPTTWPGKNNS
jgi:hypothetical protein